MTDNLNNKKSGEDKDLRRARDQFNSPKTQRALSEAIQATGATTHDEQRIITQLGKRLRDFKIGKMANFRPAAIAWVTRQGQLNVKLRELLQELRENGHIATMLFLRLSEFKGTDEELRGWVEETARREQEGVDALVVWIREHRRAVRRGIWRILRTCYDLGVTTGFDSTSEGRDSDNESEDDEPDTSEGTLDAEDSSGTPDSREPDPIVAELESQVWRKVAYDTNSILSSDRPVSEQLRKRGYWAARAWKKARVAEKEKHREDKYTIGLHGLERIVRDDEGDDMVGVIGDDVVDPNANLNPITFLERPWTRTDLERELRRAGPFRADDKYDMVRESGLTAA
jgi:hypothetical protein